MIKLGVQIFSIIFVMFFSLNLKASPLWNKTVSGMSPAEIIKSINDSHYIKDGSRLASKAIELVRVDHFQLADESFKVRFYFINEKLTQVTLSLNDEVPFSSALNIYESLILLLRSKHGKEKSKDISRSLPYIDNNTAEAIWINNEMKIYLYLSNTGRTKGKDISIFNLNYQINSSLQANKTAKKGIYKCKINDETIYQATECKNNTKQSIIPIKKSPPSEYTKRELWLISRGKVSVGMSKKALLRSWGRPDEINDSAFGSAQWIYDRGNANRQYVYVEDGYVTNWQN